MFKIKHYRFLFGKLVAVTLIGIGQSVWAVDLNVSSFIHYEEADKRVIIGGDSTRYGLGIAGFKVMADFENKLSVSGSVGYGYHPNQRVPFSRSGRSVDFYGPVNGISYGGTLKYELWTKSDYSLVSKFSVTKREIDSPSLVGSVESSTYGTVALTGNAVNNFDTEDLLLVAGVPLGGAAFLKISGGLSNWHLKTNAKVSGTVTLGPMTSTITLPKTVNVTGQDPIFKVAIASNNPNHNFEVELSNRSLKSKTDNNVQIRAIKLTYEFKF